MPLKIPIIVCLLVCLTLQSCSQDGSKEENLALKSIYEVMKEGVYQTRDSYGLKGNVRSVEQRRYNAPEDSVIDFSEYDVSDLSEDAHHALFADAGMGNDCKLTFNEAGKLLYSVATGERFSSKAVETDTLLYSENGDLLEVKNRLVGDDFDFTTQTIFEYDENGYLVRQASNHQSISEYTYDEAKNQVRIVHYDDKEFRFDNLYTYDKFGLNIETHNYEEDGSLSVRWVREYDDFGHLEKEFQYYPNGDAHESKKPKEDKTVKVYRQYDENENCTKRVIVDSKNRISIRERKFTYYQ